MSRRNRGSDMALIPPRVSCLSQKGGGGKTTTATNLATAAALDGVSTLLIDMDAQQSSVRAWGTWRARKAPKTSAPLDVQASAWDNLEDKLQSARAAGHKLIVLDTPGQKGNVSNFAASVSNIVLVLVQPSMLDLATVSETLGLNNVTNRPAFVLFNRVTDKATLKEAQEVIAGKIGAKKVAPVFLSNLNAYRDAAGEGLGVLEYELDDGATKAAIADLEKARKEIAALYAWVKKELAKNPKVAAGHVDEWGGP